MSVRFLSIPAHAQLPHYPIDEKNDVTDHLIIEIVSLIPWNPAALFSDNLYKPRHNNCHPFDIDYRKHEKYVQGKYLKVTYRLSDDVRKVGFFIPTSEELVNIAYTSITTYPNQDILINPSQDMNNSSISFYVKQGDQYTAPQYFNLGFRFIYQLDSKQFYDCIFDPTVPHDGS